jgi:hypothetical protein
MSQSDSYRSGASGNSVIIPGKLWTMTGGEADFDVLAWIPLAGILAAVTR